MRMIVGKAAIQPKFCRHFTFATFVMDNIPYVEDFNSWEKVWARSPKTFC